MRCDFKRKMAASRGVLEKLQALTKVMLDTKGFTQFHNKLSLVSASAGHVTYKMEVCEEHLNPGNTLHGGITATIVDHVSTMAIVSSDNPPGVSVDLNVSYMRAARAGDILTIKSECQKSGKSLAFATVDITNQEDKLVATGKHTKFMFK